MIKAGIIVFPGTNCEYDTKLACNFFGWESGFIEHSEKITKKYDVIFIPGGFSYGDYVSSGRLAKFAPAVKSLPISKTLIVGICNGFQILTEAKLLPGALVENTTNKFICETTKLNFQNKHINLPIAHHQGNYAATSFEEVKDKIFLTYAKNKNGSDLNIAGLYDKQNKIIGMMPHPERAILDETQNTDGRIIFEYIKNEI